ncbi:proto-oncogene tyrosine-protein kinase receptor Ret-like isoform X1 [Montipora capricornis]|uniref:proto-oncogene tyrosine-protein kinase receptor Ret-like isoform X1 n=3 Tax=Montipora capricornis TaxID=246305 RepID=UPI0035F10B1A
MKHTNGYQGNLTRVRHFFFFCQNEVAMEELSPTNDPPSSSYQQLTIPIEPADMPLQGTTHYDVGPSGPNNSARNVEYTPLDIRKGSWEVTRKDVKVEKIVGKGAFGQVAKGTAKNLPFHSGTTTVAVKMLKANAPASDKRDLKSELELMKTLKPHPHVIKLLGCVTETDPLLVLIEYVPYGDLLGYLRKSRGLNDIYYKDPDIKPQTSLTSQQLMKFAWQIADGMSYLSLRKIIHRDLAARNVLVGETETCKVTDFGMARDVQQENIYERKTRGRLPVKWTAYESLLYGKYTTKSDVWSYGVLLYEICTVGGSPYPRMDGKKIANLLQQGYRMPKPQHVDNDLYQIMLNCWQDEPEARPSFADLTKQLKGMETQHKRLLNMHIYDNELYANLEDLNA